MSEKRPKSGKKGREPGGTGQKGTFGDLRLPVSSRYTARPSRHRPLVWGAAAVALLALVLLIDRFARGGRFVSNGPLSSSHAGFAADCTNCHDADSRSVTDARCSVCHEKFGDELGVYTFSSHYLYRSDDFRRLVPSEHEEPCFACHIEHDGRRAEITRVPDARCQACHPYASFGRGHPEFAFAETGIEDPAGLTFPHVHHVREVMQRQELEDVERACLYCHNAREDGRSFEPVDFDLHCDVCHLTRTTGTPALPLRSESAAESGAQALGVETIEEIIERRGAGFRWALFTDPNEFRRRGASVSKTPVHHRDPWVLENLHSLRRELYPDAGLADLLLASAEAPGGDLRVLYREAIATLEEQAAGLRGRPEPEIQRDLERVRGAVAALKRQIEDPYAPLDETRFLLALEARDPGLSDQRAAAIEAVVADLTEPCRTCHEVRRATIARVQKDQRTLRRAEFDHRAHIVQLRCLDCHSAIPIGENLARSEKLDPAVDGARIQNLPRVEVCRECHTADQASDRCVTCHYFHPDKSRRSDLLLYLDEEVDGGRDVPSDEAPDGVPDGTES